MNGWILYSGTANICRHIYTTYIVAHFLITDKIELKVRFCIYLHIFKARSCIFCSVMFIIKSDPFRLPPTLWTVLVDSQSVVPRRRALSLGKVLHLLSKLLMDPVIRGKFWFQTPLIKPPCQVWTTTPSITPTSAVTTTLSLRMKTSNGKSAASEKSKSSPVLSL